MNATQLRVAASCHRRPVDSVRAADQFPSEPPTPGAPRDFRVPEARRFTLDNGLQVALVPWGNMPKVRVTLTIRSGNAFERARKCGSPISRQT